MLVTSKLCMLKDLGVNGNLFGGNMFSWADEAAAIFAHKITGEKNMVTKQFGEIVFKKPVNAGQIIDFYCTLTDNSTSSISFELQALFLDGTIVFKTSCVFVAVDHEGNKKAIENRDNLLSEFSTVNGIYGLVCSCGNSIMFDNKSHITPITCACLLQYMSKYEGATEYPVILNPESEKWESFRGKFFMKG